MRDIVVYVPLEGLLALILLICVIMFLAMQKFLTSKHKRLNDIFLDWNTPAYERRCHFCGKRITEIYDCHKDKCSFDPSYDELLDENTKLRDKDKWHSLEESI